MTQGLLQGLHEGLTQARADPRARDQQHRIRMGTHNFTMDIQKSDEIEPGAVIWLRCRK
jgi:hypothetical protein